MKNTNHTIEIDAQSAYMSIGVDLRINPFAPQCVAALREHLNQHITPQLLVNALAEAAGAKKQRRRKTTKTTVATVTPTGGQDHVR